jgi:hypothetical protein
MSDLTTQQMIDKAMDEQQAELASEPRCKKIIADGDIGLLEFIELTGVGEGNYGTKCRTN